MTPTETTICESPVGPLLLTADSESLRVVTWSKTGKEAPDIAAGHPILKETAAQLAAYFAGRLTVFDLPLAPKGSDFQKCVWRELYAIPFGKTRTYGDIAKSIGTAARAVGNACGRNPIPIVIPCHRVLGTSWSGGFSGGKGLSTKDALLRLEGIPLLQQTELDLAG